MGTDDPHLNSAHVIDFRLQCTIKAWKTQDPAPLRVKPIPIQVIHRIACLSHAIDRAPTLSTALFQATTDMIIIAFFFLLRPGKYTNNPNNPFRLADVQLFIGQMRLNLSHAPSD